jgi:hypothetical protein
MVAISIISREKIKTLHNSNRIENGTSKGGRNNNKMQAQWGITCESCNPTNV